MTNTMDSAHLCTPQSIFQQMNQQSSQQQQVGPWAQIPQVPPISIPWRAPCSHQQELIRFTGDTNSALHTIQQAQKRKLETQDFVDVRQRKQFITAEKMTAHFKGLHISGNHDEPKSSPSTGREGADMDVEVVNATKGEQTNDAHPRLVLSEELKRLKPILPSTFLSKLERRCMALVLWEPPSKHLRVLPTRDTPTPIPSTSNNNNNNNNNNDATPDLNNVSPPFEAMEL